MKNLIKYAFATLFAVTFAVNSGEVFAQTEGDDNISASATVVSAIQVNGISNLEFGELLQDSSDDVDPEDTEAEHFQVQGTADSNVQLTFTLPAGGTTYTYGLHDGGGDTVDNYLELTFGAEDAIWAQGEDEPATDGTAFDPTSGTTTDLGGDGYLEVYIGGTVAASAGQPDGEYTGTITLTVDYTD